MIFMSHRIFLLDEVFVSCNLHFGVSGGFFQGAKLRTSFWLSLFFSRDLWKIGIICLRKSKHRSEKTAPPDLRWITQRISTI
jgi:hypothetical protein